MTPYQTLLCQYPPKGIRVTFNRPEQKNSISLAFIRELNQVLDEAEQNPEIRFILLCGSGGFFCTGLDFNEFSAGTQDASATEAFMALLKRLAAVNRVVVAIVEGTAMAGGVGIAAACDLVYASPQSSFLLSEALWGLLPACVTPFLIRRVGYQRAFRMTLTTTAIDGSRAHDWGLVDELADQPEQAARRLLPRLARLDPRTVGDMKRFFRSMWLVDDNMEAAAIAETERLLGEARIQNNISHFLTNGTIP